MPSRPRSVAARPLARVALVAGAMAIGLALGACQGAPDATPAPAASVTPSKTVTPSATVAALPPLTLDDLRTAAVPSACEHPAGTLVDGMLPGIPRENGIVQLKSTSPYLGDADPAAFVAFNPQPAAAGLAAVAVLECDQGGVTWPDQIVAYNHSLEVIGSFPLMDFTGGPNERTSGIAWADGAVTVDWTAFRALEPSCCGTLPASGVVTADGDVATMTVPGFAVADDTAARFVALLAANDWDGARTLTGMTDLVDYYSTNPELLDLAVGDGSGELFCFDRQQVATTEIGLDMSSNDAMRACTVGAEATDFTYLTMPPTVFLTAQASTDEWTVSNFVTNWID